MRPPSLVRTQRTSSSFLLLLSFLAAFLSLVTLSHAVASYTRVPVIGGTSGQSSGDGGSGMNAKINPVGIEAFTTDAQSPGPSLLINERCKLRSFTQDGDINHVAGDGSCLPTVIDQFSKPKTVSFYAVDVAFDAFGYLYMASKNDNYNNNQILKFSFASNTVTQVGAIPKSMFIEMNYDGSVIFFIREDDGKLYSKNLNTRVYTLLSDQVSPFCDIAISQDDAFIYAANADQTNVLKLNALDGSVFASYGKVGPGSFPGSPPQDVSTNVLYLEGITDLSVDMDGRLLVACTTGNRLFLIDVNDASGSQIAGDGNQVTTATLVGSTNPLLTQTTPFYVSASRYFPSVYTYNRGVGVSYVDHLFASSFVTPVTIDLNPTTVSEGDTTPVTFIASVDNNPSVWPVPLKFFFEGTATIGLDFRANDFGIDQPLYLIPGPVGNFVYRITVSALADTVNEPPEFFNFFFICPFTTYGQQINIVDVPTSGSGDPHMVGFHGQSFDFVGRDQMIYNLLSDPLLQVNTKLGLQRTGENSFVPGPVMKTMAFLTSNHNIIVNSGGSFKDEIGFVTVDKKKLFDGQTVSFADDGLTVSFKKIQTNSKALGLVGNDKMVASVEIVLEGSYRFDVFFVENHGNPLRSGQGTESKWYRRFLNFKSALLDPERRPHGVLGQTAVPPSKERSLRDFQIQGSDNDYLVFDGLLGNKFAFNQFIQ